MTVTTLTIEAPESATEVPALLLRPDDARFLYVFAHGAGAGMRHPFMGALADGLATRGIATLRYEFPYMARGSRSIDREPILLATVSAAVAHARRLAPELPLFAGGKSMGGRMTTRAVAARHAEVRGSVLVGFPLHAAGAPGVARAEHLERVDTPMLFLQGTRDTLADLALMRDVCERLGARATLEVVDGADHSFHVQKRSGRSDAEVLEQLADAVARWMEARVAV